MDRGIRAPGFSGRRHVGLEQADRADVPSAAKRLCGADDRLPGTIGVALSLARQGVQILRVHDVAAVRRALVLFQATGGLR